MEDCIFCKIIKGEISSAKIWEDDNFLAILDGFPNTKGMSLVMPKQHYGSYVFDMSDELYSKFMLVSKKVARFIEKTLGVERVAMVAEGMGVNHAHIKLYPLHGIGKEFKEILAKQEVFFGNYQGYLSTQMGPKADKEELEKLAEEIRKSI
jgi:diadenosine tetraphosphate (Ap4A) HIT family hydrolase